MIEYQRALDQQLALLEMHPLVKRQLCSIPGVITVGVGVREKGHAILDELVYRVYVKEKRSRAKISPGEFIPAYINGLKTDVIELPEMRGVPLLLDQTLRPVEGGALITCVDGTFTKQGTMGCLATFEGKTVGLTNHHVLYHNLLSDPTGVTVKQADDCTCCCCVCKDRTIGKSIKGTMSVVTFKDADNNDVPYYLDCAIFDISLSASDLSASIREMDKIGPFSVSRKISGSTDAVGGTQVRKMGAATGLTIGKVKDVAFDAPNPFKPDAPSVLFKQVWVEAATSYKDPASGQTVPYKGFTKMIDNVDKPMFADHGDSGSVILDDNNKVVALLHMIEEVTKPGEGVNPTGNAWACPIDKVLSHLTITINKTPSGGPAFLETPEREKISISKNIIALRQREEEAATLLERMEGRLRDSVYGRQLMDVIEKVYKEVVYLVNYSRPVMVAWQRKLGPAFVGQMHERFKNNDTRIIKEVDAVRLTELLLSMSVVLEENGSPELRAAIRNHALNLLNYAETCVTLDDLIGKINLEQNIG